PGGMRRFYAVLAILFAATILTAAVLLAFVNVSAAVVTMVSLLATILIVWLILPRRYEIWPDHLRIVFPLGGWDVPYEGIQAVRAGHWWEAYGFAGVRFATAPSQTVTIL